MPEDATSENQLDFRKGDGATFATSLLNDTAAYTKE